MSNAFRILGCCLAAAALILAGTGCGQTGPLYLPTKASSSGSKASVNPLNDETSKKSGSTTGAPQSP